MANRSNLLLKNSIVPNNSIGGGANCSKQLIVQCKKITSIFVFLARKQFFLLDANPSHGIPRKLRGSPVFCFFFRICINCVRIRVTADIVTAFYI